MTEVNIEASKLAKYLQVAASQRKRALTKFVADYGPSSATVAECSGEIAELELAINELIKAAAAAPGAKSPLNRRT